MQLDYYSIFWNKFNSRKNPVYSCQKLFFQIDNQLYYDFSNIYPTHYICKSVIQCFHRDLINDVFICLFEEIWKLRNIYL